MKTCSKCKTEKTTQEFYSNRSKKDGRSNWCKICLKRRERERYASDEERRAAIAAIFEKRVQENKEKLWKLLNESACTDCDISHPLVLEFDHRDPLKSATTIRAGSMATSGRSWKKIQAEIDKCDIVCANCHNIRTAKSFDTWKWQRFSRTASHQRQAS